jgi:fission 1 protein
MAANILDDCISNEELQKQRENFVNSSLESTQPPDVNSQFQYALCLVRSSERRHVQNGFQLFKNIFETSNDDDFKRDALYYMAVAEAKMKNYEPALKYLDAILKVQSGNEQVRDLYVEVNKRMRKDGLIGIGIVGSAAAVGFAGIVGLGLALFAKKK